MCTKIRTFQKPEHDTEFFFEIFHVDKTHYNDNRWENISTLNIVLIFLESLNNSLLENIILSQNTLHYPYFILVFEKFFIDEIGQTLT